MGGGWGVVESLCLTKFCLKGVWYIKGATCIEEHTVCEGGWRTGQGAVEPLCVEQALILKRTLL